jgi:glycosyltransferase involved in cell wall biosynthesis
MIIKFDLRQLDFQRELRTDSTLRWRAFMAVEPIIPVKDMSMQMRICHVTTVHPAKDARIFYRMSRALAERGYAVTLIAPESSEDALVRMSTWNAQIAQSGRINRFALALRATLAERADIYHFHDPELIPLGLILKVLRPSAAIVYDVHEDYPAMMRVKYWIPAPLRPLMAQAARLANTAAGVCLDGIVVADPHVQQDFQHVARHKAIVYYNFPTLSLFAPAPAEPSVAQADLVYIGGMSDRSGIFVLLDALTLLAQQGLTPSVRLAGYTDGEAGLAAIEQGIRIRGISAQVDLRGRIPHAQVPAWIRSGRIGLVTLQPIAKFLKNIPTKLFEYWACGLPVIASDLPPIRPFLSNEKNGLLFTPTSAEDLARVIAWLMRHPCEGKAMGQYGQEQVAKEWNNDRQIDDLIGLYEQICRR